MVAPHDTQRTQHIWEPYKVILPLLVGGLMLAASLLPWFTDPLEGSSSAWQLSVDLGWQFRFSMLNYGLLCVCCALYTCAIAYKTWRCSRTNSAWSAQRAYMMGGLLCVVPTVLFLFQYLFIDIGSIAQLSQHEIQMLLIKRHLGYSLTDTFIPLDTMTFDPFTFSGRLTLLLDHLGIGVFLPGTSATILLAGRSLFPRSIRLKRPRKTSWSIAASVVCALLLTMIFGRGIAALACNYEAKHVLETGEYSSALTWLNRALRLNPSFDDLAEYHIERGKAWYFLHPTALNADSQSYLASTYLKQEDDLASYQELLKLWHGNHQASWITDDLSVTLEQLAELPKPLQGGTFQNLESDDSSLPWLLQLAQVEPSNVYSHYTLGRIYCELYDYIRCEVQMNMVIALSHNADVQSSAYTSLALSRAGRSDYVHARAFLLQAIALDPEYHNNTAREELSGLR